MYVVCDAIYEQHARESQRESAEAASRLLTTGEPLSTREWVISWDTWDVV